MSDKVLPSAAAIVKEATQTSGRPAENNVRFVCPHCGAYAQHLFGEVIKFQRGAHAGITFDVPDNVTVIMATCTSCDGLSIWADAILVFPEDAGDAPRAAEDMPEGIIGDFEEARSIYRRSPRGAAALLRLCVQKLLPELGVTSTDINAGIGELVAAHRIDADVQRAADSLRVIGNESVHPGTMDLRDDVDTATSLFHMVNYLVERTITYPKRAAALFDSLPANKVAAIERRDAASAEAGADTALSAADEHGSAEDLNPTA